MPLLVQPARSPSAHRENRAQQPSAAQAQLCGSVNTEWQSVRASHASSVVTAEQATPLPPVPPPPPPCPPVPPRPPAPPTEHCQPVSVQTHPGRGGPLHLQSPVGMVPEGQIHCPAWQFAGIATSLHEYGPPATQ